MTAVNGDLAGRLSEAVRAEVRVQPVSERDSRIDTPFRFPDGDHLVIRLRRLDDGCYEWSDLGHTYMHLSYAMDVEALKGGNRAQLLEDALRRLDVEDRDGELVLPARDEMLGATLMHFTQALVQVTDLRFLSRELVRSTFLEDFRGLLDREFGDRAHFDYVDPEHDPQGLYPVDCLLNGTERPLAVFALPNDDACLLATITLLQLRSWGRQPFSAGIHEDFERRGRKALSRFTDVVDKQFSSFYGMEDDVVAYLREQLP